MSLDRRLGAAITAVILFTLLTLVPLFIPRLIPAELMALISRSVDLSRLLNGLALVGLALSAIALARGFIRKASTVSLLASIGSHVAGFLLTLLVLGLGKIEGFGVIELEASGGPATNIVLFDLRLFVYFAFVTMVLKIAHSILKYRDDRLGEGTPPRGSSVETG